MNILVTGATGHLGRHVCTALIEAGHAVRAADLRQERDFPIPVVVENLLDREACYRLVDGMDGVVHLGNYPNDMLRDRQRLFIENVSMNMNIVQAAIELGVRKLVFSSSVQAVSGHIHGPHPGNVTKPPCRIAYLPADSDSPPQPANAYGLSKQVGEEQLAYAARITDMQCVAIRFPWLVSEEARTWMEKRKRGGEVSSRQLDEALAYLPMQDASQLIRCILAADLPGFRAYFPAARANVLGLDLQTLLAESYADTPLRLPADQITSLVDTSRITEETGWRPSE